MIKAAAVHHVLVRTDDGEIVRCKTRGRLRPTGPAADPRDRSGPVVGDVVRFREERGGERGVIEAIEPRRSRLTRRHAGGRRNDVIAVNVDRVIVTVAVADPAYKRGLIDRYLVACEAEGLEAAICVNKIDFCEDPEDREAVAVDLEVYERMGYPVITTSTVDGTGLDRLRAEIAGRISVFTGPSGVGKSSLLNALEPGLALRTGDVSDSTRKGRHTTTGALLVPLADGGYVVDTPGLRSFGLAHLGPREVAEGFRDLVEIGRGCRFRDCMHAEEPACAVLAALERGDLDPERYESYRRLLETLAGDLPRSHEQHSAAPDPGALADEVE